jgi:peptidoglycan LD-endopeptidase LytH
VHWSRRGFVPLAAVVLAVSGCSSPQVTTDGPGEFATPTSSAEPVSPPTPAPSTSPAPTASAATETAKPARRTYAFPVIGHSSYAHTHHDYPATDVMTNCGNRFVAVTSGVILAVTRVDRWKPSVDAGATRGGLSVSLLGDDGVRYYGSHLSVVATTIKPGVRVRTGETLGRTGDSGDASACHLHFGISPPCAKISDWWNQRGVLYPWPYLDSWKAGGAKSPVAAVKAWKAKHGCPTAPTVDK